MSSKQINASRQFTTPPPQLPSPLNFENWQRPWKHFWAPFQIDNPPHFVHRADEADFSLDPPQAWVFDHSYSSSPGMTSNVSLADSIRQLKLQGQNTSLFQCTITQNAIVHGIILGQVPFIPPCQTIPKALGFGYNAVDE